MVDQQMKEGIEWLREQTCEPAFSFVYPDGQRVSWVVRPMPDGSQQRVPVLLRDVRRPSAMWGTTVFSLTDQFAWLSAFMEAVDQHIIHGEGTVPRNPETDAEEHLALVFGYRFEVPVSDWESILFTEDLFRDEVHARRVDALDVQLLYLSGRMCGVDIRERKAFFERPEAKIDPPL